MMITLCVKALVVVSKMNVVELNVCNRMLAGSCFWTQVICSRVDF